MITAEPTGKYVGKLEQPERDSKMSKVGRPIGRIHQDDVRRKIQVSQLINVLQDHALTGDGEISPTRMRAIEILLKKSIPDLSSIELSGDQDNPVNLIQKISINLKRPDGT